jgi:asparagine synthase (glutamine-hydrolysing)
MVIVSANGEIYNYKELKRELEKKYTFTSRSDSEVLVHGYLEWGIDGLLERLDGMYAFVLYDKNNRNIYLVRDRLGIKPLYYATIDGAFCWASELKAIECYFVGKLQVDNTALYDFLTYRYIPTPKSLYKNVYKLEPGSCLTIDVGKPALSSRKSYWQLDTNVVGLGGEAGISSMLGDTLKSQLVSDVGVNFFLSGGVDSSLLVAKARELQEKVRSFTIGFDNSKFDESAYAKIVADQYDTQHFVGILREDYAKDLLGKMRDWYDEPFADFSALPTYMLCDLVKKHGGKVAISGDGGDEVFGGYPRYLHPHLDARPSRVNHLVSKPLYEILKRFPYGSRPWRAGRYVFRRDLSDGFDLYTSLLGGLSSDRREVYRDWLEIDSDYDDYWFYRQYYREDLPTLSRFQYMDIHTYLPEAILTKMDRVSMATSLEVRVPYLSHKLVQAAFSIPEQVRNSNGELKGLLKSVAGDYFPDDFVRRRKKGFGIPRGLTGQGDMENWYEQEKILSGHFRNEMGLGHRGLSEIF